MISIRKKNRICRKYSEDIFGNLRIKKKITKVNKYLALVSLKKKERFQKVYFNVQSLIPFHLQKRSTRYGERLKLRQKIKIFYCIFKTAKYKKFAKLALSISGNKQASLISVIEFRLCVIIYRMNLAVTVAEATEYVYSGYFMVNKKIIKNIHYVASVGDIIEPIPSRKSFFFNKFKNKLEKGEVMLIKPRYYEINYNILSLVILKKPSIDEIALPFKANKAFFQEELKGILYR